MARILLVDDEDNFREVLCKVLRGAGHEVTPLANGGEVLRLAQAGAFDLVITDLIMPEKEGLETIMELHRKMPALKIIAMSGGGFINAESYLTLAEKLGAARTMLKPFTGKEMLAAVAEVLTP